MKYIVRTTLERNLHQSFNQLKYELLIDKEHKIKEIFIEQLKTINDDVVLMEDDIILCRNFKERIEEVINEHKDEDIINFFSLPMIFYLSKYKLFSYNQCTYYSKSFLEKVIEFYNDKNICNYTPENYIQNFLKTNEVFTYRPCLVQHIDTNTLLNHTKRLTQRRTPYFIDYLEDLNISYEDARTKENTQKLKDYMNKQFENIEEKCNIVLYE